MHEGPQVGRRGPYVTQWEGNEEEDRACGSGEESPETEREDAQVDGANQLGSGAYQRLGGLGCQGQPQLASPLTMTKGFEVLDGVKADLSI